MNNPLLVPVQDMLRAYLRRDPLSEDAPIDMVCVDLLFTLMSLTTNLSINRWQLALLAPVWRYSENGDNMVEYKFAQEAANITHQQLSQLVTAGLVETVQEGRNHFLRITRFGKADMNQILAAYIRGRDDEWDKIA